MFGCATAVRHITAPSRGKAVITGFLDGARPKVWISDCGLRHCRRGLSRRQQAGGRRRDGLADSTLAGHRRDLDRRLDHLLATSPTGKAALTLKWSIAAAREKLFVFVTRRDVPATNNVSERALRPSVIFRKVTNGFRSAWGADVYADIRSIVATGQLQGWTALAAITEALATGHVATV